MPLFRDRLIFPSSLEQIGTRELVLINFPLAKWTNIPVENVYTTPQYVSEIELDTNPVAFFTWAYWTPAGVGSIVFYCLNLSTQLIIDPPDWMLTVTNKPKRLTDGHSVF